MPWTESRIEPCLKRAQHPDVLFWEPTNSLLAETSWFAFSVAHYGSKRRSHEHPGGQTSQCMEASVSPSRLRGLDLRSSASSSRMEPQWKPSVVQDLCRRRCDSGQCTLLSPLCLRCLPCEMDVQIADLHRIMSCDCVTCC